MATIKIKGMTCQHCAITVTETLMAVEGVTNVRVDLVAGTATFDEEGPVDTAALSEALEQAGYEME
jgi:copper chaperone CopZ